MGDLFCRVKFPKMIAISTIIAVKLRTMSMKCMNSAEYCFATPYGAVKALDSITP